MVSSWHGLQRERFLPFFCILLVTLPSLCGPQPHRGQPAMSLFNGSSFGLGAAAAKPLDPAAEISRLLNQHSHHWQTLGRAAAATRRRRSPLRTLSARALPVCREGDRGCSGQAGGGGEGACGRSAGQGGGAPLRGCRRPGGGAPRGGGRTLPRRAAVQPGEGRVGLVQ